MVDFQLSRLTDFFFWTGIAMGIAVIGNFGLGYTEAGYMESFFPAVTVLLLFLSGILAFTYFRSQSKAENKLEAGCFGGITTAIVLFNAGYSLILAVLLLMA